MASKGDLVLVTDGKITTTCIVLTLPFNVSNDEANDFYYSYCLETGLFGLIYNREIISIVSEKFAPDFEFESELFDTNYSYYADLYDRFAYFPPFFPLIDDLDDDSDED